MNFNFVSIPRCASQTIHNALRTEKYMNHKGISLFKNKSLPSFAIIREPVDRLRSWFSWHKNMYPGQVETTMKVYQTSMLEWAKNGFPTHWTEKDCEIMGITDCLLQRSYITIDDKIAVDYLIDYSNINKGMEFIFKTFGLKKHLLHKNGSSPKFKVDTKIIELAKERFNDDFLLYSEVRRHKIVCTNLHDCK